MDIRDDFILVKLGVQSDRVRFWAIITEHGAYTSYRYRKIWGLVGGNLSRSPIGNCGLRGLHDDARRMRRYAGYRYATEEESQLIRNEIEKFLTWKTLAL